MGQQGLALWKDRAWSWSWGVAGFQTKCALITLLIRWGFLGGGFLVLVSLLVFLLVFFNLNGEVSSELYLDSKCYSYPLVCSDLYRVELPNFPCAALMESVKNCSFSQLTLFLLLHFTGITAVSRSHAFLGLYYILRILGFLPVDSQQ